VERAVIVTVERFGRLGAAVFSRGRRTDMLERYQTPPAPPVPGASFAYDANGPRDLSDSTFDAWRDNDDGNVLGPMRLFRSAVPDVRRHGMKAFVAMSGIEALQPWLPNLRGRTGWRCTASSSCWRTVTAGTWLQVKALLKRPRGSTVAWARSRGRAGRRPGVGASLEGACHVCTSVLAPATVRSARPLRSGEARAPGGPSRRPCSHWRRRLPVPGVRSRGPPLRW